MKSVHRYTYLHVRLHALMNHLIYTYLNVRLHAVVSVAVLPPHHRGLCGEEADLRRRREKQHEGGDAEEDPLYTEDIER